MNPEECQSALEAVAAGLRKHGVDVEYGGSGLARVLYAERGSRAVEISALVPGAALVRLEGDDSSPDLFDTLEAAAAEAIAWLTEK